MFAEKKFGYSKILSFFNGIGSIWIFLLMLVIINDVGGRVFFNHPMIGTPEIVSNSIIGIAFLQIGYVLMVGRHVRSTIIYDRFSETGKNILDLLAYLMGIFLFILLIYSSWDLFLTSVEIREFEGEGALRVPTYPVRFIILFGSVLILGEYVTLVIKTIKKLIKNR